MNLAILDWMKHIPYRFSIAKQPQSVRSRPLCTLMMASLVASSLIIPAGPAEAVINPAQRLYRAWRKNDKKIAERIAEGEAVNTLFARPWRKSDQWHSTSCEGAAGSVYCTWERPSEKLIIRYKNDPTHPGKRVSEVRFEAS
jgi:hypothetical protein